MKKTMCLPPTANKSFHIDYYVLGFLWGSSRFSGNHLLIQNSNKKLLNLIKEKGKFDNKIFSTITTNGNISWRMKIHRYNHYVQHMIETGYEGRKGNKERKMPEIANLSSEREFLRGYFSTHFTLDTVKSRKRRISRLRFYASKNILDRLNTHLHNEIGTTIKKIGDHSRNDICKIIYYTAKKEVPEIISYLQLEVK